MKRFLITSTKFTGHAELVYNQLGILVKIDLTKAIIANDIILALKKAVPIDVADLSRAFGNGTVIVQADLEVTFEMFWTGYKKKINRLRAEALWKKLNKSEQVQAYYGIANYDAYLKKEDWRSKADPDTYIRSKYFQNEYR